MDSYEFYRLMAPTIAAIKCGHTGVGRSPDLERELERLARLPFQVKVLDSKVCIFRDYARGGALAGKEIRSINGVLSSHIVATMLAASMKDGDVQTTRQRDISGDFGLNLILLLGLRAPYEVGLAGAESNQTEKAPFAGLTHAELIKMSQTQHPQDQGSKEFADLKFLDGGQIAHLTYSEFGENTDEGRAFMKRSFRAIQAKGSKTLILDVRGNGGGESELGEMLFSYLIEKPFKYYDDMTVNKWSFSFFPKYRRPQGFQFSKGNGRTPGRWQNPPGRGSPSGLAATRPAQFHRTRLHLDRRRLPLNHGGIPHRS